MEECFKIVRIKDGEHKFLFHGVGGSRKIPKGEWLKAEKKMVRDGHPGTYYWSGFHVFTTEEAAWKYLDLFKDTDDKDVLPCSVEDVWMKLHSRCDEVRLARWMYVH